MWSTHDQGQPEHPRRRPAVLQYRLADPRQRPERRRFGAGRGGRQRPVRCRPRAATAASTAPSTTANGASGAPAAQADYNYPWQSSSGATGAQYFYRQLTNKVLWCDNSSPYWPRNSTITGCNGGIPNPGPSTFRKRATRRGWSATRCGRVAQLHALRPARPACRRSTASPAQAVRARTRPARARLPECLACTCNNDTVPVPAKRCSSQRCRLQRERRLPGCARARPSGCTGGNPVYQKVGSPACTSVLFDPYTNANTDRRRCCRMPTTVNGGVVCRHNNLAYTQAGSPATGRPVLLRPHQHR